MKLLIVNGSPRAPRSNSRRYAELFQARWKGEARYAALTAKNHAELAAAAGMLHDIHTYATMDPRDHAHKGSAMARDLLNSMKCFEAGEIDAICSAIYHHSSKEITHAPFDEVLKDADVMQHCLYNPLFEVMKHEKERFGKLKEEFGLTGREP